MASPTASFSASNIGGDPAAITDISKPKNQVWRKVRDAVANFFRKLFSCGCNFKRKTKIERSVSYFQLDTKKKVREEIPPPPVQPAIAASPLSSSSMLDGGSFIEMKLSKDPHALRRLGEKGDDSLEKMWKWTLDFSGILATETLWGEINVSDAEKDTFRGIQPELEEIKGGMLKVLDDVQTNYVVIQQIKQNIATLSMIVQPNKNSAISLQDLPIFIIIAQTVLHRMLSHYQDVSQNLLEFLTHHQGEIEKRDEPGIRRFLELYERHIATQENPVDILQGVILKDIKEKKLSDSRYQQVKEQLPRVLEWMMRSTEEFDPKKLSDFFVTLIGLAKASLSLFGEDEAFQSDFRDFSGKLDKHMMEFLRENLKLIDIPLRRVLLAVQYSEFPETFRKLFSHAVGHTKAYEIALKERDKREVELQSRIAAKEKELEQELRLNKSNLENLRNAVPDERIASILQKADAAGNDEAFVLLWLRKKHKASQGEEIPQMAKRLVYEQLQEREGKENAHYKALFGRKPGGESLEEWLDSQFERWLDRKMMDAFAKDKTVEAKTRELILLESGKSPDKLKEELLEEWTDQIYDLLLPAYFRGGEPKELDGLYRLWDRIQLPGSLRQEWNRIYKAVIRRATIDRKGDQCKNFESYAKKIGEEAALEYLQREVKSKLRGAIERLIQVLSDPKDLEVMFADKILPNLNDLFLSALTSQCLVRHISDIKALFLNLMYENLDEESLIDDKNKITDILIQKFKKDQREFELSEEAEAKVREEIGRLLIPRILRHLNKAKPKDPELRLTEKEVAREIAVCLASETHEVNDDLGKLLMDLVDIGGLFTGWKKRLVNTLRGTIQSALSQALSSALFDVTKDHRKILESAEAAMQPYLNKDEQLELFFSPALTRSKRKERAVAAQQRRMERVDQLGRMLNHLTYYSLGNYTFIVKPPSAEDFTRACNKIFDKVFLYRREMNQNLVMHVMNVAKNMLGKGNRVAEEKARNHYRESVVLEKIG